MIDSHTANDPQTQAPSLARQQTHHSNAKTTHYKHAPSASPASRRPQHTTRTATRANALLSLRLLCPAQRHTCVLVLRTRREKPHSEVGSHGAVCMQPACVYNCSTIQYHDPLCDGLQREWVLHTDFRRSLSVWVTAPVRGPLWTGWTRWIARVVGSTGWRSQQVHLHESSIRFRGRVSVYSASVT